MTIENNTITTPIAIYTDEAMSIDNFHDYVCSVVGRKKVRPSLTLRAPYSHVEYLNSPAGLIVLAHHNTPHGQVDGIHPASIGKSIINPRNIIEPLKGTKRSPYAYNVHYMTRRSQGSLILEAFGRMIDGGDSEVPLIEANGHFTLEIYNSCAGPIVGVIESEKRVYVIMPVAEVLSEAA